MRARVTFGAPLPRFSEFTEILSRYSAAPRELVWYGPSHSLTRRKIAEDARQERAREADGSPGDSGVPLSRKRRLMNPFLGRIPDRSFAVCQDLRRFLVAGGLPPSCLEGAYNGVDPGAPPDGADRERARRELGIAADRFVVGDGPEREHLKELARARNLSGSVRFSFERMLELYVGAYLGSS